eukprot:1160970-Pelagomonas_calceolata.AAC.8
MSPKDNTIHTHTLTNTYLGGEGQTTLLVPTGPGQANKHVFLSDAHVDVAQNLSQEVHNRVRLPTGQYTKGTFIERSCTCVLAWTTAALLLHSPCRSLPCPLHQSWTAGCCESSDPGGEPASVSRQSGISMRSEDRQAGFRMRSKAVSGQAGMRMRSKGVSREADLRMKSRKPVSA